jgi:hypothetical protein
MKRRGISHATMMRLMCALPLLIFFALAGVQLNPLWVPVIMILCCLAMFYLTAGACGHERAERVPEVIPEGPTLPPAETLRTDDVCRVHHSRRVGAAVVQERELLRDPDETHAVLKERSQNTGMSINNDPARGGQAGFLRPVDAASEGRLVE